MKIIPLTLAQANTLVEKIHRHHKPVRGHRFSIGVAGPMGHVCGAAIVGRPVSRELDAYAVAEVTRLVTDGTKNACSILYGACARIAREMGFDKIQTYILEEEYGTSLLAAGWVFEQMTTGGDWNHSKANAGTRRVDQPMGKKKRFGKVLTVSQNAPVSAPTIHKQCDICGERHGPHGGVCG